MARKIKNKYVQPPSSILKSDEDGVEETKKDLGKAVNDANVLKNVSMTNKKSDGKDLPSYKEAWDSDLEGIKGMYGSYGDYVNDMEGIEEGDDRDIEREKAREESLAGTDQTDFEEEDIAKKGSPGDATNPFTSAQARGNSRLNKSQTRLAIQGEKKVRNEANGNIFSLFSKKGREKRKAANDAFDEKKLNLLKQRAAAQSAAAGNAADQLTQGRNPYTSGEKVLYRKEMSKKTDGSDITQLTEDEAKGYTTVDELKKKNTNPDAVGQFGLSALKFGRRK